MNLDRTDPHPDAVQVFQRLACATGGNIPQAFFLTNLYILDGTYEAFDDLPARYPSRGSYVSAVATAADRALAEGWITAADHDRFIERAVRDYESLVLGD